MSARKTYHVTRRPDGDWQGKAVGGERASVVTSTKAEAVKETVEIARKQELGQVVIHGENGQIQSERTYGKDPPKSKG